MRKTRIISLFLCCMIVILPSLYITTPTLGHIEEIPPLLPGEESSPADYDIYVLNMLIGSLKIWNDDDLIYIELIMAMNDWYLDTVQIHVANIFEEIPNVDGIPLPENFGIQTSFIAHTSVEYTYQIPITEEIGIQYDIAIHLIVEQWSSDPDAILAGKQVTWVGDTLFSTDSDAVYLRYFTSSGTSTMPEDWTSRQINIHHIRWHRINNNFNKTYPIWAKNHVQIGNINFLLDNGVLKVKIQLFDGFWISKIDYKSHQFHHYRVHEKLSFNPAISEWEYEMDLKAHKNHFHLSDFNIKLTVWGDFGSLPNEKPHHNWNWDWDCFKFF